MFTDDLTFRSIPIGEQMLAPIYFWGGDGQSGHRDGGPAEARFCHPTFLAVNQWFKKEKKQLDGGTSIQRNIILSTSGQAKFVLPYEKTEVGQGDVQQLINVPWAIARVPWALSRTEMTRNADGSRIIDLIKSRRVDATVDLADLLETAAWLSPQNRSAQRSPLGLAAWIIKMNATDVAALTAASAPLRGRRRRYLHQRFR